jgi:hypothetical protein
MTLTVSIGTRLTGRSARARLGVLERVRGLGHRDTLTARDALAGPGPGHGRGVSG